MATYREQGIVLRSYKLGETDRIVHLLTRERGKVRAVAKGVRRPGSRFGGRLESFSYVDLQLYEGRNLDTINQAELLEPHAGIRADHRLSAAASVLCELTDQIAQEGEADRPLFQLLRAGLQVLAADPEHPAVFVDAFLLRAAGLAGFHVDALDCAICQRRGPHAFLSVKVGGTLCPDHAPTGTRAVPPEVVTLLALLVAPGEWAALPGAVSEHPRAYQVASSYTRAFVEHHLHRQLRSYDLVPR